MRWLILASFFSILHAQQPMTVCDAIINTHNRQEVIIRGVIMVPGVEKVDLFDSRCNPP
jgi:hypothetical protein